MSKMTRRGFLLGAAATGTGIMLKPWRPDSELRAKTQKTAAALPPHRVVHTHSTEATYWDYATGWYGDYVRQPVVDSMTDRGLLTLTNTSTLAAAWGALLPAYTVGQKIAIKINLNNAAGCGDDGQVIDALPQPITAVIRGLKTIGVAENDIWVYDTTSGWHEGQMPTRLKQQVTTHYPGVQFHAAANDCATALGFSSTQKIHFNIPAGKPVISDRPICNTLVNATYLINMPIMKKHGMAGVTLGFKNHYGSFEQCELAHWAVTLDDGNYVSTYNALVDICSNPHIKNKTILTVGDGLYAARINNYNEVPSRWTSFGNRSPNSLFFSTDPVAIDCVMYDLLKAENGVPDGSDDYLKLASAAGLGTFEHWDASHQYHTIDYQYSEVNTLDRHIFLPLVRK